MTRLGLYSLTAMSWGRIVVRTDLAASSPLLEKSVPIVSFSQRKPFTVVRYSNEAVTDPNGAGRIGMLPAFRLFIGLVGLGILVLLVLSGKAGSGQSGTDVKNLA